MTFRKGRLLRGYVDNDRASCCRRKRRGLHPLRVIYSAPTTRRNQTCANNPAENRNSEKAGSLESGSRSEPARLRRPRLASGTATRPSRKTTQYEPNGRASGRGGAPPPGWLRGMATAALPKFPARSMAPCRARTLSWPEPEYPKPSRSEARRSYSAPQLEYYLTYKPLAVRKAPQPSWVRAGSPRAGPLGTGPCTRRPLNPRNMHSGSPPFFAELVRGTPL